MNFSERPGYKHTQLGWLPSDWRVQRLSSLTKSYAGGTPDRSKPEYFEGDIPWVKSGEVNLRKITKSEERISDLALSESSAKLAESGSVLVAMYGATAGKVARLKIDAAINQAVLSIRALGNELDNEFLFWTMESSAEKLLSMCQGAAQPNLSKGLIDGLEIATPSLPEQQKIAAILNAVDDSLDVIARQIDATQTLKQGLMQTLFSKGVGTQDATGRWFPHTEFKDSELGKIPALWDVGAIADYVSALRSGVSVNAEDRVHGDDEVGVLKVSCVSRGGFYPNCHKTVVPEERERVAEPVLQGRIIVSRANTPALVGESAYVDSAWPNLYLPDKLWQIEPSERPHSIKWLSFYLQSPFARQEISKAATGTSGSMKNIAKPAFLSIRMPLVPLAEQEHIAAILSGVTSKIEALSSKQGHYQTLKRGLMQKLLTGEWRVKLDSPSGTV